jgi:hypothetical protein
MNQELSSRTLSIAAGLAGIAGVLMIGTSFGINQGPPLGASNEQLIAFAAANYRSVMWGAWLQSVGPLLIVGFALTLVKLAGATSRLSGWLTLFGGSVLMMVSLAEVIFYISALDSVPETMGALSNAIGHAIQHLYFFVAAPSLFFPMGAVIWNSKVLPRAFGALAFVLGSGFFVVGITTLYDPILSDRATSLAAVQAFWWLGAAIVLMARSKRFADVPA